MERSCGVGACILDDLRLFFVFYFRVSVHYLPELDERPKDHAPLLHELLFADADRQRAFLCGTRNRKDNHGSRSRSVAGWLQRRNLRASSSVASRGQTGQAAFNCGKRGSVRWMAGDILLLAMAALGRLRASRIFPYSRNLVFYFADYNDPEPPHDSILFQPCAGELCPCPALLDTLADDRLLSRTRCPAIPRN